MTTSNQPEDDDAVPDGDTIVQTEFDWESVAPSTAIIETIAIAANRDPSDIEPLYESVNSDALDNLIESSATRPSNGVTTVSFTVSEYEVSVTGSGTVAVRHNDEGN